MKRLEKLKLHNLEEICVDEQKSMKGGGEWITGPDGSQYWYVGEVTVYGSCSPQTPNTFSQTTTFCDYSAQGNCNWAQNTAAGIIGAVPVLGDAIGIIENKVECERSEAITLLLQRGISCNDTIRMDFVVNDEYEIYYNVYYENGDYMFSTR